jgi:hypothetical protein
MHPNFKHTNYYLKKQFLKILGGSYRIYDSSENLVFFGSLKAFKLREDIRIYSDEAKTDELILIKARSVLDFGATYDVTDAKTQEKAGALRRKGIKSTFLCDEWIILDNNDREIGFIKEDSAILGLVRRFLTNLIPQTYRGFVNGAQVLQFKQNFNPFALRMSLDFSMDTDKQLDRRLGIAGAILLSAIEGKQN